MFNPANQTHFSLSLDGLRHDLQVLEFSGHEGSTALPRAMPASA